MNRNFELIRDYFLEKDPQCEVDEARTRCRIHVVLQNLSVLLTACTLDGGGCVAVVVLLPVRVPPPRHHDLAEFITRVNYGMKVGSFDMDHSDGEIRLRLSAVLDDCALTPAMLSHWMLLGLTTVDGFFLAILQLIAGTLRPDQAVEQGEGFLRDLLERHNHALDE